jgi:EAL domain-containing protein (putative c-di-GMP-specific phosphodiesterase class I)
VELEQPFDVQGQEIHIGVSTGIAFADPNSTDPGAVLRDADTAMYEAKSAGRGRWVVFDEHLRRRAVDRQKTENALRRSRHGENLELRYQPVFDLGNRRLLGFEALLRWWHMGELVAPARFVPVAEETGLIVPMGNWVLAEATKQLGIWQSMEGFENLGIAVNVSARQIQRPDFLATVAQRTMSNIAPGSLTMEITESVVLEQTVSTAGVLAGLRDLSVRVAVDDFGTGYSSLTYLHRLPFDIVKLDRSFVAGVTDSDQKRAIVTAVLGLTNALGLQSIAEGIETQKQLDELRRLGCDSGQGHLVAGAMSSEMVTDLLRGPWRGGFLPGPGSDS